MKSYKLTPELLYAVGLGLDVQMMECVTHWIVLFKTFVKNFHIYLYEDVYYNLQSPLMPFAYKPAKNVFTLCFLLLLYSFKRDSTNMEFVWEKQ